MVCRLALCLGRKVEERLGKRFQSAEEEEGEGGEEGRVKAIGHRIVGLAQVWKDRIHTKQYRSFDSDKRAPPQKKGVKVEKHVCDILIHFLWVLFSIRNQSRSDTRSDKIDKTQSKQRAHILSFM